MNNESVSRKIARAQHIFTKHIARMLSPEVKSLCRKSLYHSDYKKKMAASIAIFFFDNHLMTAGEITDVYLAAKHSPEDIKSILTKICNDETKVDAIIPNMIILFGSPG